MKDSSLWRRFHQAAHSKHQAPDRFDRTARGIIAMRWELCDVWFEYDPKGKAVEITGIFSILDQELPFGHDFRKRPLITVDSVLATVETKGRAGFPERLVCRCGRLPVGRQQGAEVVLIGHGGQALQNVGEPGFGIVAVAFSNEV